MWRRFRGAGRDVRERLSRATTSVRPCKATAASRSSDSIDDESRRRGRKVTFSFRVVVVLVPCTEDLRPFSEQLWWGADDYLYFRRRYDLAIQSATAATASKQRDGKQQRRRPPRKGASASAIFDAAALQIEAREPTKTDGTKIGTRRGEPKAENASSRPPRVNGPVPPLASSSSRCRVIKTNKEWTPSAAVMAAKAAAEAEEEGYRTESMSSASDSTLSSGDSSDPDSDDEARQEHLVPVFGREQLRQPAAASRHRPRRLISA